MAVLNQIYDTDGVYLMACSECKARLMVRGISIFSHKHSVRMDVLTKNPPNFPIQHCWYCKADFDYVIPRSVESQNYQ